MMARLLEIGATTFQTNFSDPAESDCISYVLMRALMFFVPLMLVLLMLLLRLLLRLLYGVHSHQSRDEHCMALTAAVVRLCLLAVHASFSYAEAKEKYHYFVGPVCFNSTEATVAMAVAMATTTTAAAGRQ